METHTRSTTGSTGWQGKDDNYYDVIKMKIMIYNYDICRSQSVMPGGGGSLNPLSRRSSVIIIFLILIAVIIIVIVMIAVTKSS